MFLEQTIIVILHYIRRRNFLHNFYAIFKEFVRKLDKLDEWKLSEESREVAWNYQISKNFLRLEYNALDTHCESKLIGKIKNFNTLDAFKVRAGFRLFLNQRE